MVGLIHLPPHTPAHWHNFPNYRPTAHKSRPARQADPAGRAASARQTSPAFPASHHHSPAKASISARAPPHSPGSPSVQAAWQATSHSSSSPPSSVHSRKDQAKDHTPAPTLSR